MFVAVDGKPAGLLGVTDPIKEATPEAVRLLHEEGVEIIMLTGDKRETAEAVARRLGIDLVEGVRTSTWERIASSSSQAGAGFRITRAPARRPSSAARRPKKGPSQDGFAGSRQNGHLYHHIRVGAAYHHNLGFHSASLATMIRISPTM
jgi:magnesium-transporting ATPase (P-type)